MSKIPLASKSCVLLYWQRYYTALEGVEQKAPPVFGRAAITLGIGPRYSFLYFLN